MDKYQNTVFVVISKHIMRRNILETDFWSEFLRRNSNTRIVLIGEQGGEEFYEKKFGGPNVVMRFVQKETTGIWHRFVIFLVRTGTSAHGVRLYRWREYENGETGLVFTAFKSIIGNTLGRFAFYKRLVRFLYSGLALAWIEDLFDEFKPDLVFTPSLIDINVDALFGVAACKREVRVVGMVRSWDNLAIHGLLPFVPDRFILQNQWLKESAEIYQSLDMTVVPHNIIGLPHYDVYKDAESVLKPREAFFEELGLDPEKRVLYFTGFDIYHSEAMIPRLLNDAIQDGSLPVDTQVLFTRHPASKVPLEDYELQSLEHVHYVDLFDRSKVKFQGTDEIFINLVSHASVVINVASTVAIDCAVLDKPVICIAFDDPSLKLPYWSRAERLFDSFDHYEKLIETGGARLAHSPQELVKDINTYLNNPHLDSEKRKKVIDLFVAPFDGKAGTRLVNEISREIEKVT